MSAGIKKRGKGDKFPKLIGKLIEMGVMRNFGNGGNPDWRAQLVVRPGSSGVAGRIFVFPKRQSVFSAENFHAQWVSLHPENLQMIRSALRIPGSWSYISCAAFNFMDVLSKYMYQTEII